MQRFEYKVVPAPRRGEKARGVKSTEDRFALALSSLMNELGAEGWEYVRADALPCDERAGLTGTKTSFQNMLVFRRVLAAEAARAPAFMRGPAETVAVAGGEAAATAVPPVVTPALAPAAGSAPLTASHSAPPSHAPALGPARADVAAE